MTDNQAMNGNGHIQINRELVEQAPEKMPEIVRSMHHTAAQAIDDAAMLLEREMQSQVREPHPLGFHMWRYGQRWREVWWVAVGKWSLHRAWQNGYDRHIMDDSARRARGGK